MTFNLIKPILTNIKLIPNVDGTITVNGVIAQIGIQGAPANKFIQTDIVPPFSIPATETSATQPAFINAHVAAYVATTYPNS
jgi:hypothetical protein